MLKMNRYISLVFLAAFLSLLVGCSKTFIVKPSGNFSDSVRFDFYESKDARETTKFGVVEFVVQKEVDGGEWVTIWELRGKQSLSFIEYGSKYDDLNEVVSPDSLEKNVNYRVLVAEVSFSGPKGYSGSEFYFKESGEIVVKKYK